MSIRILHGDCRDVLKTLPDESVHCCVTSPPYFGLRDYGMAAQIGLETTPDAFVAELVAVFREVRRVLRDDGTLWLNLGDSYAGSGKGGNPDGGKQATNAGSQSVGVLYGTGKSAREAAVTNVTRNTFDGIKAKDLIGIPWRVAFALQQPYYTGQIKNERDREWLAAIIDGEGCFFIHKRKAGSSAHSSYTRADGSEANYIRTSDTFGVGLEICNTSKAIIDRVQAIVGTGTVTTQSPQQNARRKQTIYRWRVAPNEAKRLAQELYPHLVGKRHQARLLFNCPSTGDAGAAAHQAMMDMHNGVETSVDYPPPPSLFEPGWYLRQDVIWSKPNCMPESVTDRCTKAHEYVFLLSKSARYYCEMAAIAEPSLVGDCGSSFINGKTGEKNRTPVGKGGRVDDGMRNKRSVWTIATQPYSEAHFATMAPELAETCIKAGCPAGGVVLDPFGGAGTTGLVADRLQRDAVLIELNPQYIDIAEKRLVGDAPLFAEVSA